MKQLATEKTQLKIQDSDIVIFEYERENVSHRQKRKKEIVEEGFEMARIFRADPFTPLETSNAISRYRYLAEVETFMLFKNCRKTWNK